MLRVLIESIEGDRAFMAPAEVAHLVRVRRAKVGTWFEGVTGAGIKVLCRLDREEGTWFGRIETEVADSAESPIRITLALSLLKKDNFELALQKAVELGVAAILPVISQRTEIRLDDRRQEKKVDRWARIVEEAVKQCGRSRIPSLVPPLPLAEAIERSKGQPAIMLDEEGELTLDDALGNTAPLRDLTLFIGPEGGWDEIDRRRFQQANIRRVKLGPRILRAETAVIAVLAIIQYQLGDMQPLSQK